jgi:hypothetical protein
MRYACDVNVVWHDAIAGKRAPTDVRQITARIALITASMLPLFSAATQIRPVSRA